MVVVHDWETIELESSSWDTEEVMWGVRRHLTALLCKQSACVRIGARRANSDKVSLNIHQTIAGRRRFYKHVGVEEEENSGMVRMFLFMMCVC